jgi:class I fructose-bisphosphate aldolase
MTWLSEMGLPSGKRSKLYRVFYGSNGPANGTGIFLPVDQGLEHGPRDFLDNPDAADTRYLFKLAKEGNFSALVLQVGQVSKFAWEFAGEVPLIVKVNGKTEIPSDDEAFSPVQCSVEEAARLGADAIGYTMYTGSPRQDDDFIQFRDVREAAEALGLPVIVWAYPRGAAVNEKGGKESLYQVSYAARIAAELGADIAKINFPKAGPSKGAPKPYDTLDLSGIDAARHAIQFVPRTPILISGGSKEGDDAIIEKARMSFEAGAKGLIFGRNMFQRPLAEAVSLCERLHELASKYPS